MTKLNGLTQRSCSILCAQEAAYSDPRRWRWKRQLLFTELFSFSFSFLYLALVETTLASEVKPVRPTIQHDIWGGYVTNPTSRATPIHEASQRGSSMCRLVFQHLFNKLRKVSRAFVIRRSATAFGQHLRRPTNRFEYSPTHPQILLIGPRTIVGDSSIIQNCGHPRDSMSKSSRGSCQWLLHWRNSLRHHKHMILCVFPCFWFLLVVARYWIVYLVYEICCSKKCDLRIAHFNAS